MNSLVKIPPYSKLNFQGEIVFTQNCCNINPKFSKNKNIPCHIVKADDFFRTKEDIFLRTKEDIFLRTKEDIFLE